MKRNITCIIIITHMLLLAACGPDSQKENNTEETDSSKECLLSLVDTSVSANWTAFKTTERIGVSGKFDIVSVSGTRKAKTVTEVLKGASFEIPVASVNSANPERDKKIFGHFFSNMSNTSLLAGKVLETGTEKWKVGFLMNGVRDTLELDFQTAENSVTLTGVMELAKWNALASVDSLNQVCYDLHKGADGISKLWPDVKIEISANLASDCN